MNAILIWEHSAESSTIIILLTHGFNKDIFDFGTSSPKNWKTCVFLLDVYASQVLFEKSTEAKQSFARSTAFMQMLLVIKRDSLVVHEVFGWTVYIEVITHLLTIY